MANLPENNSLLIGLKAARANIVPGLFVQAAMLAMVLGYYYYPPLQGLLGHLAGVKQALGLGFSVPAAVVAGALLPEVLKVACFQGGVPTRRNMHVLFWSALLFVFEGAVVDYLYRMQSWMFGDALTVGTVVKKVAFDEFVFNPLFAGPLNTIAFDWISRGVSRQTVGGYFTWRYYKGRIIPTLLATWGVWIPLVAIIYSLPADLQFPLFSLALTFWAMLLAYMSAPRKDSQGQVPPGADAAEESAEPAKVGAA